MKLKQLKQGDSAVPFTATDLKGNQISLSRFRGKKVYLVFFRKAACPFCNMALRELINNYDQFQQRGIEIVTLFASSANEIMKYAGKQNPPFPIIPDADYQIYDKYGIEISYTGMLKTSFHPIKVFKAMVGGFFSARTTFQDPVMPADFLIDENQEVQKAHYGKFYDDHLPVSEILKWEPFSVVSAKAS